MTEDTTMDSTAPPFVPGPPFNDPGADVILRSSDMIDFRVHRLVLSLASPFFEQMFSLPQPTAEPEVPTIIVTEPAAVLDRALRFWYPGAGPILRQTLDELREVLEALIMKYDMQFIVPAAKRHLRDYLDQDPVAVYAISCRHEWKDVALEAAKASLRLPLRNFEPARRPQLNHITGDAYHTLLHYHSECGKIAKSTSSSLKWTTLTTDVPGDECPTDPDDCPLSSKEWLFADGEREPIAAWFAGYLKGLPRLFGKTPIAPPDSPESLSLAMKWIPPDCSHCRTVGVEKLVKFGVDLRAQIAREIDSVELNLGF
ncbi:hypothetical protein FB451DRAFT_452500 [Mycena latifolia]|nr:hypothetical protein FB451DRAFT_452500 [Mycena latifolia]